MSKSSWSKDIQLHLQKIKTAKYFVVVPFRKNLVLEELNPASVERRIGFRKVVDVPIRFIPVEASYDSKSDNSSSFFLLSISLQLRR